MRNKIIYISLALLIMLGIMFIYQKNKVYELEKTVFEEKIDSLIKESEIKTIHLINEIDSLTAIKQKKIYVPYKKKNYSSRNVDDAISILSKYVYKESETTNTK